MKRFIPFILALALIAVLSGCAPIMHSSNVTGRVIYNLNGTSFDEALTAEEVQAVVEVLNGKIPEPIFLTGEYACGYDEDLSFIIGNTTYYLEQDDCSCVQNASTDGYIEISDAERQVLEKIFTSRGGKI